MENHSDFKVQKSLKSCKHKVNIVKASYMWTAFNDSLLAISYFTTFLKKIMSFLLHTLYLAPTLVHVTF
jgi:hypothetical protein